jgi:proline racemase
MPTRPSPLFIAAIDAYVAGAPVRLVTGGWPPMRGRDFAARVSALPGGADHLRVALLHEPRGCEAMSGALLVEPSDDAVHAGLAFMHHSGWSRFCGHAAIGAAAIARRRGLVHLQGGGPLRLQTLAGIVEARAAVPGRVPDETGSAPDVLCCTTPEAFLLAAGVPVTVGSRTISVDLAWCAGLYAFTDAEVAGVPLDIVRRAELGAKARSVRDALSRHVTGMLPEEDASLGAVVFVGADEQGDADLRSVTVYDSGDVDRSPGGGSTAALLAVMDGMGMVAPDRPMVHRGPRGDFRARLLSRAARPVGADALRVEIEADVYFTGEHTFHLEPGDPTVPWPSARVRLRSGRHGPAD